MNVESPRDVSKDIIIVFFNMLHGGCMHAVCPIRNTFVLLSEITFMTTTSWDVCRSAAMFVFSSDVSKTHRQKSSSDGFYRVVSGLSVNEAGKSCRYTYGLVFRSEISPDPPVNEALREKSLEDDDDDFNKKNFLLFPAADFRLQPDCTTCSRKRGDCREFHHPYCY